MDPRIIKKIETYLSNGRLGEKPINEDPMSLEKRAKMLKKFGPLSVFIFFSRAMQFYMGGVFYDSRTCSNFDTNHGMVLVGMDEDSWIL